MKKLFIFVVVVLAGSLLWFSQHNPVSLTDKIQTNEDAEVSQSSQTPSLIFKEETYQMVFPNGESAGDYSVQVPYVVYADGEVKVFENTAGLRIDQTLWSPNQEYIYFSYGNGKDSGVRPYVFSIENRSLHKVCLESISQEDCLNSYAGFSRQDDITVSWEAEKLVIEYNNPGLAPGVSEAGPAIGLQVFTSSDIAPWVLEEVI